MLTAMSDEKPEGMETKDVHTASGGVFQGTEAGTPGYHPAAVPNRNQTTINGDEAVHEQGLRQPAGEGDSAPAEGGDSSSSSAKSTGTKSTRSSSASSKSS
jgi:hypothetical protein